VRQARAGGFLIEEHSALATGMADARSAIWDDPSVLYYNPAAMTELKGYQITLGDTLIFPGVTYTPLPEDERESDLDGTNAADGEFRLYYPLHVYLTVETTSWLSLGISLNNPFGLGVFWPDDWDGRYTAYQANLETFFTQPVISVSLARLLKLPDDVALSIGVGVNYVYGKAFINSKVDVSNFARGDQGDAAMIMEGDGHGFGATWSLFAAWKPWFSFGATVRSNVHMEFEGEAKFEDINEETSTLMSALGIVLPESTGGSTHMNLPWNMNFGVAFHGLEKFTFAFDFYYTMWESYNELAIEFDCSTSGECYRGLNESATYPKDWKNGYQISIGAEYRPIEAIAVRLGYGYVSDPTHKDYYDALLPDGNRHLACAGIGWRHKKYVKIDLGYMFAYWKGEKNNDVGEADTLGPNGKAKGTYETMAHLLAISIGLSFGGPRKSAPPTMNHR
ncbi:MAG: outer membrane protein transport protein, partial [Pseudomonadota bacterium]